MLTKKSGAKTLGKKFDELVRQIKETERYDQEALRSDIADQIASLMKVQQVNNAELARRLNKSRAYVTKILQGNANFTLDSLVQIARALGAKYIPTFIPLNEWTPVEPIQFCAVTQSAQPSESYEPQILVESKKESR